MRGHQACGLAILFVTAIMLTKPQLATAQDGQPARAPNVVYLLGDDQAWFDFNFLGGDRVEMPHLDRLAAESAMFTQGYVPTSLCMPSLATILTGRFPHEHLSGTNVHGIRLPRPMLEETYRKYPPVGKRLTAHGYSAYQAGKWWDYHYETGGFTDGMTDGIPVPGSRFLKRPDEAGPEQEAALDQSILFMAGGEGLRIGREGMQAVEDFLNNRNRDQPFFLWYAPMLPHTPHNPPQRLYEKYVRDDRTESEVLYLAMCEWYDENVGELLALLDETGERDNTLIVFVVDNGFVPLKDHPGVLDPRSKTSPYNAGVRTPILLNWPGRIRPARYDIPVHTIDLVPTTLAAAGIEIPEELPGKNLLEVCQGKDLNRSTLFGANFRRRVPSPKLPTDTMDYRWCLSWPWKLILPRDGQSPELYDISSDPHETVNLAEDHSAIVADLTRQLDDWWDVSEAVSINN